jgi:hypothetical protein
VIQVEELGHFRIDIDSLGMCNPRSGLSCILQLISGEFIAILTCYMRLLWIRNSLVWRHMLRNRDGLVVERTRGNVVQPGSYYGCELAPLSPTRRQNTCNDILGHTLYGKVVSGSCNSESEYRKRSSMGLK